jgi:transposase-like protein
LRTGSAPCGCWSLKHERREADRDFTTADGIEQLASQFGVNRSTVRDGIRLLEQSRLVARDGGKRLRIFFR